MLLTPAGGISDGLNAGKLPIGSMLDRREAGEKRFSGATTSCEGEEASVGGAGRGGSK